MLASLIADTRQRRFQAVLVWALDRLSREGALAILSLVNKLSSCGVKVLSHQESWTFKALKQGSSEVYLEYSLPWEGGEKGEWTCTVNVVVK